MEHKRDFITFQFEKLRQATWLIIALFLIGKTAFSSFVNLVIFPSGVLSGISNATNGLVQPTLVVNLIGLLIIVIGVIVYLGKINKNEIGINLRLIPRALVITFIIWASVQIIGAIASIIQNGALVLDTSWQNASWQIALGLIIAQLAGNALVEEIEYRGFLLPQLFLKINGHSSIRSRRLKIALALFASQTLFALMHIPNRIYVGMSLSEWPLDLFTLLGIGVLYSFVYLRTGNLFIAVGLHSLANVPLSLFTSQEVARFIVLAIALLIVFLWRKNPAELTGEKPTLKPVSGTSQ